MTAIDPGPEKSARVELYFNGAACPVINRADMLTTQELTDELLADDRHLIIGIEDVRAYSVRATSQFLLETVKVVGQVELCARLKGRQFEALARTQVTGNLTGNARAGDREVREAVLDRWGMLHLSGKRKLPAPLDKISADLWSAIAVGLTVAGRLNIK